MEIACSAKSAGRSDLLGVLYDELARCVLGVVRIVCPCVLLMAPAFRKKWEDLSGKLGDGFNLAEATKRDAVPICFMVFCLVMH